MLPKGATQSWLNSTITMHDIGVGTRGAPHVPPPKFHKLLYKLLTTLHVVSNCAPPIKKSFLRHCMRGEIAGLPAGIACLYFNKILRGQNLKRCRMCDDERCVLCNSCEVEYVAARSLGGRGRTC